MGLARARLVVVCRRVSLASAIASLRPLRVLPASAFSSRSSAKTLASRKGGLASAKRRTTRYIRSRGRSRREHGGGRHRPLRLSAVLLGCDEQLPQADALRRTATRATSVDGAVAGGFDIESVALHELGHLLGLDHSTVPGTVMWPTITSNFTLRSLQPDDLAGIRSLYPPV